MPASADPLREALDAFTSYADRKGVPVLPGMLAESNHAMLVVTYGTDADDAADADPRTTMAALIAAVERLDVAFAVADVTDLTADTLETATRACETRLAGLEALGEDGDPETEDALAAALDTLAPLEARIGQIAMLRVWAVTRNPAVVVERVWLAPWERALAAAQVVAEADAGDDDDWGSGDEAQARRAEYEAREKERRAWAPGPRRTEVARRLAEHADFPRCKREADRVHLLRTMLGDEAPTDDYLLKETAREAGAIYRLEIAPASR